MNEKILVFNGNRIQLEDFIVTQTIDRDYKISLQSKDSYLRSLIMEKLGTIKDFVLIDEKQQTIVKNAKVVLVSLTSNDLESDMIKFICNSVSYADNPLSEYKKSVFSLLKLYDEMDEQYISMVGCRPVFQISGFRRYGNSTILLEIAQRYKNLGEQVAIILATEDLYRQIPKQNGMTATSIGYSRNYLMGKKITVVLFDNYSIMDKAQVEEVITMTNRFFPSYTKYIGLN